MSAKMNSECLSVLEELEYISVVPRSDRIVSDIIRKSLEQIGKSYSKAILYNMCSLCNLSEYELLTNYDLFEKSLSSILGKPGNAILTVIKKEILTYAVMADADITVEEILNPSLKISDIVKYIHEVEVFDFVRRMGPHHHAILLYSKENNRNKILEQFLNSNKSGFDDDDDDTYHYLRAGLLSNQTVEDGINPSVVNSLSFEKLFQPTVNKMSIQKLLYWIARVHPSNVPPGEDNDDDNNNNLATRIVGDGIWWLTNGYVEWLVSFEKLINKYKAANNMSMLCAFDISKISASNMSSVIRQIISCHDSVITDNPFAIYNSRAPRTKIRARH
jgi:hypothetical protein